MNKQKLALFIVLIMLVMTVVWSFISAPRQQTVSTLKRVPGQSQQIDKKAVDPTVKSAKLSEKTVAKSSGGSDERVLRLDLLERDQSGFKGYRRNIFKPMFTDDLKVPDGVLKHQ